MWTSPTTHPKLTYPVVIFLCNSWATCNIVQSHGLSAIGKLPVLCRRGHGCSTCLSQCLLTDLTAWTRRIDRNVVVWADFALAVQPFHCRSISSMCPPWVSATARYVLLPFATTLCERKHFLQLMQRSIETTADFGEMHRMKLWYRCHLLGVGL